ncbi:hypothetical protein ACFYNZ_15330 [Streptomyces kebangsaanensis]|uniref:Uncharacterized protein n=1 Tax=Streptomyces kebangsaanensis TaxID=864058 RepID=A0ABW6KWR0_9ACTN
MTQNAEKGLLTTGPSQEDSAARGSSAPIVAQAPTRAQQQGLFPVGVSLPVARPVLVTTSGRAEFAARCPACKDWHRHVGLGKKRAPCGATYRLETKGHRQEAA